MKDENSKKKRKLSGIRLEAPEFKTQEEEEDYKKQLACWRLPLWKQIHMAIHNVKPANFPGCHFPNRVADKLTDYITGYTLVRDLLPPMPERVKKFFRRMAKKTSPGKAKPRQRRETLKTRVKVLMNKELEHNGYEAVYASAIISTIFQEVVGEKTSPSTIGRTVRRSQQKGTQRAS